MFFTIISFVFIVCLLTILGGGNKLERRLEEIEVPWNTSKKKTMIREVFLDEKGILIVKEGDNLIIDISPYNLHRKFFIPRITEKDIQYLINTIEKLDSVSCEEK